MKTDVRGVEICVPNRTANLLILGIRKATSMAVQICNPYVGVIPIKTPTDAPSAICSGLLFPVTRVINCCFNFRIFKDSSFSHFIAWSSIHKPVCNYYESQDTEKNPQKRQIELLI